VVITGLGAVTPLGNDVRSSYSRQVKGGRSITAFGTPASVARLRGEGLRADAVDRAQAGKAYGNSRR
jgi:hypothetical protein